MFRTENRIERVHRRAHDQSPCLGGTEIIGRGLGQAGETPRTDAHANPTGETDGSVTDIAGWKASLPPYATDLHYQQLNATQLNELIGKGGLWASKARREMTRRKYK